MTEKSFDDAPINYNNEEAHAWAAGYNAAASQVLELAADVVDAWIDNPTEDIVRRLRLLARR